MLTILKAKARAFWQAVFADEPEPPAVEYVARLEPAKQPAKPKRKAANPRKKVSKAKPTRKTPR